MSQGEFNEAACTITMEGGSAKEVTAKVNSNLGNFQQVSGVKVHLAFPAIAHTWHSRDKLQLELELHY